MILLAYSDRFIPEASARLERSSDSSFGSIALRSRDPWARPLPAVSGVSPISSDRTCVLSFEPDSSSSHRTCVCSSSMITTPFNRTYVWLMKPSHRRFQPCARARRRARRHRNGAAKRPARGAHGPSRAARELPRRRVDRHRKAPADGRSRRLPRPSGGKSAGFPGRSSVAFSWPMATKRLRRTKLAPSGTRDHSQASKPAATGGPPIELAPRLAHGNVLRSPRGSLPFGYGPFELAMANIHTEEQRLA